jgi:hypothetical protein
MSAPEMVAAPMSDVVGSTAMAERVARRRRLGLLAALIFVAVSATIVSHATPSLATDASYARSCSNAGTPQELFLADITARDVSCATAIRFIVGINGQHRDLKYHSVHYRAYLCRPKPEGVAARIRCTHGRRVITWYEGT